MSAPAAHREPRREHRHRNEWVSDAATEILDLYPRLAYALERDQGTNDDGQPVTTAPTPRTPVNEDVLAALVDLRTSIPTTDNRARLVLGDPLTTVRDIPTILAAVGSVHARLLNHPTAQAGADRYAAEVFRWQRTARTAIGLTRPATPVGEHCPLHPEPARLMLRGDEGTYDPRAQGHREAITWRRGEVIFCPTCQAEWKPPEWPFLGRLIRERNRQCETPTESSSATTADAVVPWADSTSPSEESPTSSG